MIMKRTLLALAVLCVSCTFAMVPRHRFAREATGETCAPETPCSWAVYRSASKIVYMNVDNTYCTCGVGRSCTLDEDDATASAYVYKCKPIKET